MRFFCVSFFALVILGIAVALYNEGKTLNATIAFGSLLGFLGAVRYLPRAKPRPGPSGNTEG